jgi:alpha-tubulin suppressor-like RCC1 family protein
MSRRVYAALAAVVCSFVSLPSLAGTIAGGHGHTVVLTPDGRVFTWGWNQYGQLGDGTTITRTAPTDTGLTDVVAVAAGVWHTIVLKADGTVWTFGDNALGQLGDGTLTVRTSPVQVPLTSVVAIAAGQHHSMALQADGTVWTWGHNASGQLGHGTTTGSLVPVLVPGFSGADVIAAGGDHTVVIKAGIVWGCGANASGQLGDGTTTARLSPVPMSSISGATAVSAGGAHTLVLLDDGTLRAVGANERGQLGDGTFTGRLTPVVVSGLSGVAAISSGWWHNAARLASATTVAWGFSQDGQVGDGTSSLHPLATPTPGLSGIATVGSGYHVNVAIDDTGVVRAWGWNGYGQVGDGTTTNRYVPVVVSGPDYAWLVRPPAFTPGPGSYSSPRVVTIATPTPGATIHYTTDGTTPTDASPVHTAPLSVDTFTTLKAVAARPGWTTSPPTSGVYTFNFGTLAPPAFSPAPGTYVTSVAVSLTAHPGATIRYTLNGSDPTVASPVYSAPLVLSATTVVKARAFHPDYTTSPAASGTFSIQVAAPTFTPEAGTYAAGQTVAIASAAPDATITYTLDGTEPTTSSTALPASGTLVLGNYTLKAKAWKSGFTPSATTTATYAVSGSLTESRVAVGLEQTFVVTEDGVVWAWGNNSYGQLGGSDLVYRMSPRLVSGLTGVRLVAGGGRSTAAAMADGTVWTSGQNLSGQLGDGTMTGRLEFRPVPDLSAVTGVASGYEHVVVVRSEGTVLSWGKNNAGQLGDGTTLTRTTPTLVTGLPPIRAVVAGSYFSLALTTEGTVWGWGDNWQGQLGDGTKTNQRLVPVAAAGLTDVVALGAGAGSAVALRADGTVWSWGGGSTSPALVPGLPPIVQIAAGAEHTLALASDGTVWAWGRNVEGQLGTGTPAEFGWPPVQVPGLNDVVSIAAAYHSVALAADGSLWAWGRNTSGQVGDGTLTGRSSPLRIAGPGLAWRPVPPSIGLWSGTYTSPQAAVVTHPDPTVVLRYTLSGLDPTDADPAVSPGTAIPITVSLPLRVSAWRPNAPASHVVAATYELKVLPPVLSPASGTYATPQVFTLTLPTAGSHATYTVDATEPDAQSPPYLGGVTISDRRVVKARAFRAGWTPSDAAYAGYTITAASRGRGCGNREPRAPLVSDGRRDPAVYHRRPGPDGSVPPIRFSGGSSRDHHDQGAGLPRGAAAEHDGVGARLARCPGRGRNAEPGARRRLVHRANGGNRDGTAGCDAALHDERGRSDRGRRDRRVGRVAGDRPRAGTEGARLSGGGRPEPRAPRGFRSDRRTGGRRRAQRRPRRAGPRLGLGLEFEGARGRWDDDRPADAGARLHRGHRGRRGRRVFRSAQAGRHRVELGRAPGRGRVVGPLGAGTGGRPDRRSRDCGGRVLRAGAESGWHGVGLGLERQGPIGRWHHGRAPRAGPRPRLDRRDRDCGGRGVRAGPRERRRRGRPRLGVGPEPGRPTGGWHDHHAARARPGHRPAAGHVDRGRPGLRACPDGRR